MNDLPLTRRALTLVWISLSVIPAALCQETDRLSFTRVKAFESPFPQGGRSNSFVLSGIPNDGPCIAIPWSTDYENCTTVFYNAAFDEVDRWRYFNGDQTMNVFDGDLDGDGTNEVILVTRMRKPGVHVFHWNSETLTLEPRWSWTRDTTDLYHRGSAAGNFTDAPGLEVVFGSSIGELFLLDANGSLLASVVIDGRKTVQRMDIVDVDGDGYDEIILATGRNPGEVRMLRWQTDASGLDELWRTNLTIDGRGGDNCYEAVYHPRALPGGRPGIAATTEEETVSLKGSVALLNMDGEVQWQRVFTEREGRAGGCGFGDLDGDGNPEILTRTTGMHGMFVYDNRGNRVATVTNVKTSSAGPRVAQFTPGQPVHIVSTTEAYRVENVSP